MNLNYLTFHFKSKYLPQNANWAVKITSFLEKYKAALDSSYLQEE